ncbi:MAG: hypothetical protein OEL88_03190 [Sterolibacteriaceae bacterium MAG5]|nr:hypothetical protein [Candidatus Nitricoxidireducens bremensis]
MRCARIIAAFLLVFATAAAAVENNTTLLVQIDPDGRYRIWHSTGATQLNEDELLALAASALPEGGEPMATSAGPAVAYDTRQGVVVALKEARGDDRLLIDRDDCGGVKVWHAGGPALLGEDDLTELMLTALPGGGKRIPVGKQVARGYSTRLGVIVLLWKPTGR